MTPHNFNWFLHTMLFYHTKHVIKKQANQERKKKTAELNDDSSGSDNEEQ